MKFLHRFHFKKPGFTLLEILIVSTVLAVLAAVLIIVLNPAEMLAKGRDAQRISDLTTLKSALGLYLTQTSSADLDGDNSRGVCGSNVWIARNNAVDITDTNVGYRSLSATGDSSSTGINSSGWLPVDFTQINGNTPLAGLPLDPNYSMSDVLHVKDSDMYYIYSCNADKTFELVTNLESQTYRRGGSQDRESTDGGDDPDMYEVGTNLFIIKDIPATPSWAAVNGKVYNDYTGSYDYANDVVLDSSGNIYVAGRAGGGATGEDWVVVKYTPTGAVDTSWGASGRVTYNSGGANNDFANAITIDSSNNIYVAGRIGTNGGDMAARKYDSSGNSVTGWGTSGMVSYNSGGTNQDYGEDIAIDSEGSIYIAGAFIILGGELAVRKYDSGGNLVTGWGSGGMIQYSGTATAEWAYSIVVDSAKNIYVGGYRAPSSNYNMFVRKYDSTGTLAGGWGSGGSIEYDSGGGQNDQVYALAMDSSNNLYLSGFTATTNTWVTRKYNSSGNPVTSWGSSGMVTYTPGGQAMQYDIVLDAYDNIYVVGYITGTHSNDIVVRKYKSDGILDTSWANSGMITYDSGNDSTGDLGYALAIDSSNNIFVVGSSFNGGGSDFITLKYTSFGALDDR